MELCDRKQLKHNSTLPKACQGAYALNFLDTKVTSLLLFIRSFAITKESHCPGCIGSGSLVNGKQAHYNQIVEA